MGLNGTLRITRPASIKDLVLLPRNQHALARYTDKAYRWKLQAKDVQILRLLPSDQVTTQLDKDAFISLLKDDLSSSEDEKTKSSGQMEDPAYRRLTGPKSRSPTPSSSSSSDEDELSRDAREGRTFYDNVTQKNQALSTYVRAHPEDVKGWLEFVNFQDQNVAFARAQSDHQKKKEGSMPGIAISTQRKVIEREERRAIADGKLAILDKALLLCRSEAGVRQLMLERLRVAEEVYEMDDLAREWRKAVKKDADLKSAWLDWMSRDARLFKTRSGYVSSLEATLPHMNVQDRLDQFDKAVRLLRAAGMFPHRLKETTHGYFH